MKIIKVPKMKKKFTSDDVGIKKVNHRESYAIVAEGEVYAQITFSHFSRNDLERSALYFPSFVDSMKTGDFFVSISHEARQKLPSQEKPDISDCQKYLFIDVNNLHMLGDDESKLYRGMCLETGEFYLFGENATVVRYEPT